MGPYMPYSMSELTINIILINIEISSNTKSIHADLSRGFVKG
jgi:hypothetical protein